MIYAIARCILYPNYTVVITTPVKDQSKGFISSVEKLMRRSYNLRNEIKDYKAGTNESYIKFKNGSQIIAMPFSENALGQRAQMLIVDEYVRTDKKIIDRVFKPMLTSPRTPPYKSLSVEDKKQLKPELQRQLFLSSIRSAEEWSYKEFENYAEHMTSGNNMYFTIALPYQFGIRAGYIVKQTIEEQFRSSSESWSLLLAEYLAIPERGNVNSFFKYSDMDKARTNVKSLTCMSDDEFIEFKEHKEKWPYYVEKLSNEIRILAMDVAVIESSKNDNTMLWVIRLIPDNGKYKKIVAYGESMHGINSLLQAKRAKQLFYELECDWFVLDSQGVGVGIFDSCTTETYDEIRDITYPAWTVVNYEDAKMDNRVISSNAVPVIYAVKTPIQIKSAMFVNMRDMISTKDVSLLVDTDEAVEYLNKIYKFYKINDDSLRSRLLNSYLQTNILINEAINLEQIATQGYINLKEKSGRRKDRVMALAYGLYYSKLLEDEYKKQNVNVNLLDYVIFA